MSRLASDSIDLQELVNRCGGEPDFLLEILDLCEHACMRSLASIQVSLASRNAGGVSLTAHALAETLDNVGAARGVGLARALHTAIQAGRVGDTRELVGVLASELGAVTLQLRAVRRALAGTPSVAALTMQ